MAGPANCNHPIETGCTLKGSVMKKFAVLALAMTATAAVAVPAFADDDDGRHYGNWIGVDQVHQKLTALGYTRITEVERDDGRYEVDATSPEGIRVDLKVHRETAEILRSKRDDDDDRYDD
jgi:hypothetical protein